MTTDAKLIRNVAVISNGGSGKTTLIESLLLNSKTIPKRGFVEKGTAVMTTEAEETAREGSTITPHVGFYNWDEHHVNIVDTPGYVNFLEATRSVCHSMDGAVVVVSAADGIKPETERAWGMAAQAKLPAIVFINEMDKEHTDYEKALEAAEAAFEIPVVPLTLPLGSFESLKGVVDVLSLKSYIGIDGIVKETDADDEAKEQVESIRSSLIEKIVETDDDLLEQYLEGNEPDEAALLKALSKAVHSRQLIPAFIGSALKNVGVHALANAVNNFLPSPADMDEIKPLIGTKPGKEEEPEEITRKYSADGPFSAVVFKTIIDPFSGRLSIVRVLTGEIKPDSISYNNVNGEKEKGGHLFVLQGKDMKKTDKLVAGEIGAIAKLDHTQTGDTVSAVDGDIVYPKVKLVEPVLIYAVKAEGKTEDKVAAGLTKLCDEDPTLKYYRDPQTAEMILAGMGQNHLRVTLERLARKFNAKGLLQAPKIPYKETIRKHAKVQGKLKKQTGGHGQFGDCWIEVEPTARDEGFSFEDKIVGGVIPKQFIPSVEKGVREAMVAGILAGFPVVDVRVKLVFGSFHAVDSSDFAFKVAGSMAFKKGMEEASPQLLEPVMALEINVPDDVMGDVIKDLNSRRAKVSGMTPKGNSQVINAEVPMAEVLEYGNILQALTSGRGLYTMSLSSYQEVPGHIADKVVADEAKAKEAKD